MQHECNLDGPEFIYTLQRDPVGNGTSLADGSTTLLCTFNDVNEPVSIDGTAQVFDASGRMTLDSSGTSFTWTADNKVETAATDTGLSKEFLYDPLGRLVVEKTGAYSKINVHKGNHVLAAYEVGDLLTNPIEQFVYGEGVDRVLLRDGDWGTGGGVTYFHSDQQGSTVCLTDDSGQVVEQYDYSIFGSPRIFDSQLASIPTSQYGNQRLYTGQKFIDGIGLYYFRARFYEPSRGHFLSRDPLGFIDGMSQYLNYFSPSGVDPSGLVGTCLKNVMAEEIARVLAKKVAAIIGKKVAVSAGRFAILALVDGPLPVGDIIGAVWGAWSLANAGIEVGRLRSLFSAFADALKNEVIGNLTDPATLDCLDTNMHCCSKAQHAVRNAIREMGAVRVGSRGRIPYKSIRRAIDKHLKPGIKEVGTCCAPKCRPLTKKEKGDFWFKRTGEREAPTRRCRVRYHKPGPDGKVRFRTICETKEIHHDKPRHTGGGNEDENLKPLWPTDHAKEDPYRHPGYDIIEILE